MSYKITIVNNENGETVANEENAIAIIGAISSKKSTQTLGLTECNSIKLAIALHRVKQIEEKLLEKYPAVKALLEAIELFPDED